MYQGYAISQLHLTLEVHRATLDTSKVVRRQGE